MRRPRMLGQSFTYYHIISRVNHGEYLLDDGEKERLVGFFRDAEVLGCGQIVTYSILDNHWHCLLSIDHNAKVPEELVVKRVRARYGDFRADEFAQQVAMVRELNGEVAAQKVLDHYRHRMNNLAEFAKDALQRFTMSYNRRHGSFGSFWSGRYKSSIVEGKSVHDTKALATVAAYIDLNAVRAGIVTDPGAYRFCGYGAAMGGDKHALAALGPVLDMLTQGDGAELSAYRTYIFRQGFDHAVSGSRSDAFSKLAHKVLKREGKINSAELIFCKVRYFSDGLAIGSRNFIEDLFQKNRNLFSEKRKSGARTIKNADSGGLCCMRDLRLTPISPSGCVI